VTLNRYALRFTFYEMFDYIFQHFDRVWPRLVEHLQISVISLVLAMLIALPLGLLLSRIPKLATPVLVVLGIIYTIPSFSLFVLLIPIFDIGIKPAIVALTLYALVVVVRNTMVAFNGVDPAVIEAARGMGMSSLQILWKIEIPLALPIIVAGMRIGALSTIGLTTIAAYVGAGGLGSLLKEGINNTPKLYAGVICVAALAIMTDLLFRLLERTVKVPA
jgi:osmoprotectant transport system permease protein